MALQIITADKTTDPHIFLSKQIQQIQVEDPQARILYIVPEHVKFDMESLLLNLLAKAYKQDHMAMLRTQVLSFKRLEWYLMSDQISQNTAVSEMGLAMILRQVLERLSPELVIYQSQVNRSGFIERLLVTFQELIEGNIQPEDLTSHSAELSMNEHQKLQELQKIYQSFLDQLSHLDIHNYQGLEAVMAFIQAAAPSYFAHYYVIIDHYYHFTGQQLNLITEMIAKFAQVQVILPLVSKEVSSADWQPVTTIPQQTYQQLKQLCHLLNLDCLKDLPIEEVNRHYHPNIVTVAQHFKAQQAIQANNATEIMAYQSQSCHQVWQHDSLHTELRHVANEIHYLVSQKGYRYQDILVVARDLDRYQALVGPFFAANEIPYFFDHVSKMAQHPFFLWLEALLNLERYNWQYQDIMVMMKSNLFLPKSILELEAAFQEVAIKEHYRQVSHFENIILANGFVGYRFSNPNFVWHFDQENIAFATDSKGKKSESLGQVSQKLREWLLALFGGQWRIWKGPVTGKQAVKWLYHLVDQAGLKVRMIQIRDKAIEAGAIEDSLKYEQIWQLFVNSLDEFYTLYHDQVVNYESFIQILMSGLKEGTFHIIPPTMDQVTITNIESPQVAPYKICFVIGADDQQLPKSKTNHSLLNGPMRQQITSQLLAHQYLADNQVDQYYLELMLVYQVLLAATDRIYISYTMGVDQQNLQLSPYFESLNQHFKWPSFIFSGLKLKFDQPEHLSAFGKASMMLSPILFALRQAHEAMVLPHTSVLALIQLLNQQNTVGSQVEHILERLYHFSSLPTQLTPKTALALYGRDMNLTVSKVEQFYQDPYSHFLIHGLKLQERQSFELSPARTGDYFHEFLDSFVRGLQAEQLDIAMITPNQMQELYLMQIAKLAQDYRFNLFDKDGRMHLIKQQMDNRLYQIIKMIQKQTQLTQMKPYQSELVFGKGLADAYPSMTLSLASGGHLNIRGKIDRIDQSLKPVNGDPLLQVIDYKTGNKKFELKEVYYGLDLQILTYLAVALDQHPNHQALGAFYQPLVKQFQKVDATIMADSHFSELDAYTVGQPMKYQGFITLDSNLIEAVDPTALNQQASMIYPIKRKKDGQYDHYTNYFSEDELSVLFDYLRYQYKRAGDLIQAGEIHLAPYKTERFTPSLQAKYRVITGFDATEHYQIYRHQNETNKTAFEAMKEVLRTEKGADKHDASTTKT